MDSSSNPNHDALAEQASGVSFEQALDAKQKAWSIYSPLGKVTGIGVVRSGNAWGLEVDFAEPLALGTAIPSEVNGVPIVVDITGPGVIAGAKNTK